MNELKNIFKTIQDTFNNKYVKALYITIFLLILVISIFTLITLFPAGSIVVLIFLSIYLLIFDFIS